MKLGSSTGIELPAKEGSVQFVLLNGWAGVRLNPAQFVS